MASVHLGQKVGIISKFLAFLLVSKEGKKNHNFDISRYRAQNDLRCKPPPFRLLHPMIGMDVATQQRIQWSSGKVSTVGQKDCW